MKKILIITTGGTISCGGPEGGLKPEHGGSELIPAELSEEYELETLDLFALDSTDVSPEQWRLIHCAVNEAVRSGKYDGIVLLHGTDTLEYTAAMLWQTVKPEIPVIITGSMLPAEAPGSDARRNIAEALLCAANAEFAGVYAVFAGRVIGGGEAVKRFSDVSDAFRSFSGSDCGYILENKATLERKSAPDKVYRFPGKSVRIAVIKLSPFTAAEDIRAEGCAGAVIESYGAGGLPAHLAPAAAELAKKMPVIMTTSCTGGARLDEYEVGRRALACGIIDGGKTTTACAAVRLFLSANASGGSEPFLKKSSENSKKLL